MRSSAIETFFEQEAKQYGLQMERPIRLTLAPPLSQSPPALEPRRRQALRRAVESADALLGVASGRTAGSGAGHQAVRPVSRSRDLACAPALASACRRDCSESCTSSRTARMQGSNDTVIAHELLHTLGATDKYDLRTQSARCIPTAMPSPSASRCIRSRSPSSWAGAFRSRARSRRRRSRCSK